MLRKSQPNFKKDFKKIHSRIPGVIESQKKFKKLFLFLLFKNTKVIGTSTFLFQ